jgi:hypothetical protein
VTLGCGLLKSCQSCPAGQSCVKNACVNCVPKTCADFGNAGCGHDDGCTQTPLDCCTAGMTCKGTICCPKGDVNYQGSCCQPQCDPNLPPGPQNTCGLTIYCNGTQ